MVTSLRDRLRSRRNVSVAEVGHLNRPTDAIMAICMVGNDARFIESSLDALAHEIHGWYPGMIQNNTTMVFRPSSIDPQTGYNVHDG